MGDPVPAGVASRRDEPGLLTWQLGARSTEVTCKEVRLELWVGLRSSLPSDLRMAHVEWTGMLFTGKNRLPVVRLEIPPLLASGRVVEPDDEHTSGRYFVCPRVDPGDWMHALEPWSTTLPDGRFELRSLSRSESLEIDVHLDSCAGGRLLFPLTRVERGERAVTIVGSRGVPFRQCILFDERLADHLSDQRLLGFRARDARAPERSFPLEYRTTHGVDWRWTDCPPAPHLHGALPVGRYDFLAVLDDGQVIQELCGVTISGKVAAESNPVGVKARPSAPSLPRSICARDSSSSRWPCGLRARDRDTGGSDDPGVRTRTAVHGEVGRFLHSRLEAAVAIEADGFEPSHVTLRAGRTEVTLRPLVPAHGSKQLAR